MSVPDACPCGRTDAKGRAVPYAACCGRYLDGDLPVPDAEHLMRSRYTAFVRQRAGYLLATWHPAHRPAALDFEPGAKWLGLEVRGHRVTGADTAEVEFVARHRVGGRAVVVEGPAVVTEASGWIPGVPHYMAQLLDVIGPRFEDPLASMLLMFASKLPPRTGAPELDADGLLRMDDR